MNLAAALGPQSETRVVTCSRAIMMAVRGSGPLPATSVRGPGPPASSAAARAASDQLGQHRLSVRISGRERERERYRHRETGRRLSVQEM